MKKFHTLHHRNFMRKAKLSISHSIKFIVNLSLPVDSTRKQHVVRNTDKINGKSPKSWKCSIKLENVTTSCMELPKPHMAKSSITVWPIWHTMTALLTVILARISTVIVKCYCITMTLRQKKEVKYKTWPKSKLQKYQIPTQKSVPWSVGKIQQSISEIHYTTVASHSPNEFIIEQMMKKLTKDPFAKYFSKNQTKSLKIRSNLTYNVRSSQNKGQRW